MTNSKNISSDDECISVPYSEVTHVCMTPSMHALLQYMLLFDYDTVAHHTCYFTGYGVSKEMASRLPGIWSPLEQTGMKLSIWRLFKKFITRLTAHFRYPFLNTADIYAFDVGFVPPYIGRREYSLLSDGPLGISQNMQVSSAEFQRQLHKKHSVQGLIEELLLGHVAVFGWGNNKQCKAFYLTEENTAAVFENKPVHIASLNNLWNNASQRLKDFICYVFDVSDEDIYILNSKRYMFLTQPMVRDGILNEDEYLKILESIFSHYGQSELLLKLHPRDDFDYKRYFPQVAVYSKKVNMQLLVILGTQVARAATICSSSVNSFPDCVEVDWYGTDIHPKLKAWFGEAVPPCRPYNQM